MRLTQVASLLLAAGGVSGASVKRDPGFSQGQPIDGKGKGAPLLGIETSKFILSA